MPYIWDFTYGILNATLYHRVLKKTYGKFNTIFQYFNSQKS